MICQNTARQRQGIVCAPKSKSQGDIGSGRMDDAGELDMGKSSRGWDRWMERQEGATKAQKCKEKSVQ